VPARDAPAEIGILVYPAVQLATVHGLSDIFTLANQFARAGQFARVERSAEPPAIRVTHWTTEFGEGPVECTHDTMPGTPPRPRFIVIPLTLADRPTSAQLRSVAAWLRSLHQGGTALGSVCSGAFILAETGLLGGRLAATHWVCADELRQRFPDIRVDSQIRIVDYGDIVTVGGFMAWVDMGLKLVERFLGPSVAEETARFLLDRPGAEKAPYFQGFSPKLAHGDEAILRAQQMIHASDGREISLAALAEGARLERRTLLRRFARATGMTPIEYARNVKMARARELLEFSTKSLKELAWELGYEEPNAFARAFRRMVGVSPADYRRQYGQGRRELGGGADAVVQPA
jgi:transcriptional regulator GlxA family with amidase domain